MSSNLNKVIMTAEISQLSVTEKDSSFIVTQVAYTKLNENQKLEERTNEYKVRANKPNLIEMLNKCSDLKMKNIPVLIVGYVAQSTREEDDTFAYYIVAQDIRFLTKLPFMTDQEYRCQLIDFNSLMIFGNVGADPETKEIKANIKSVTFSVATSITCKTANLEKKELTTWHKISIIANSSTNSLQGLARLTEQHLRKGMKVLAVAALQSKSWTDKSGKIVKSIQVVFQNNASILIITDRSDKHKEDRSYGSYESGNNFPAFENRSHQSYKKPNYENDSFDSFSTKGPSSSKSNNFLDEYDLEDRKQKRKNDVLDDDDIF